MLEWGTRGNGYFNSHPAGKKVTVSDRLMDHTLSDKVNVTVEAFASYPIRT